MENMDIVNNVDGVDLNIRIPKHIYVRQDFFNTLSPLQFFTRFRLTKPSVLFLLDLIEDQLEYIYDINNSLSPINQILLTLRYYATGNHLLSIGDFVQADKSTVSRTVSKVSRVIAGLKERFIHMPRNGVEIAAEQNNFFEIATFPRVVGAIDGTHVKILSPGGNDAELFRNRKSYFSINVQAVSSANLLFRDIVARWPGSTHDATVFNNSRLKFNFERGNFGNGILLGDSGYMNTNYLVFPYVEPNTRAQNNYNRSHISTRVKVENLFGVWKRRFPVMAYGIRLKLENVLPVIIATAVLHNIARLQGEEEPPAENDIFNHELQELIRNGQIINEVRIKDNRYDLRRQLVETYFSR